MTIPNVSMSWCQRKARCKYCPNLIESGTPLVTVFYWNKGTPKHKGFNTKFYYHPDCWVKQGLDYLSKNPYVPVYRGAKPLPLTPEERAGRNILLRRKCSLEQRRRAIPANSPRQQLLEARLDTKVAELMLEIAPLGGIPKKWLEPNKED